MSLLGTQVLHSLERLKKINFPFHIVIRESKNNVNHMRSRGAPNGIFINGHRRFYERRRKNMFRFPKNGDFSIGGSSVLW